MKDCAPPPLDDLRPPDRVMRLRQMGAMFPTRLSFLRILTRRLGETGARIKRSLWEMDADGIGRAVHEVAFGGHIYALVSITRPLAPENRSDRVIATAWDAAFVLHDGPPSEEDLARIEANAPMQEAGRFDARDLVLSRANKSMRLWDHVVGALRAGGQPDADRLREIGYLMRTTAVYGNGKFGIADRARIADRPGMGISFLPEMLTVWLIRQFTLDLVEHVGGACLDRALARHLGIGNATGLGMAPFLVTHPVLLNNWMLVRETALARVRAVEHVADAQVARIGALVARARRHLAEWQVPDEAYAAIIAGLREALPRFADRHLSRAALARPYALDAALKAAEKEGPDLEELVVALLLEPFGDLVDGLADCLTDPFGDLSDPVADTGALRALIAAQFDWALGVDYNARPNCARFWYVSEEKLEPRLGWRHDEPGADLETPLDIARRVRALWDDLPDNPEPMADFLARHPDHLLAVERVQMAARYPYAEIRDNLIADTCRPIDMLRAKLSLFGAAKFDPKSDLWTRVTLAQGAPLADELDGPRADDWWLAVQGE